MGRIRLPLAILAAIALSPLIMTLLNGIGG